MKRTHNELSDNGNINKQHDSIEDQNASKRRKLVSNIRSSIFKDSCDHDQFLKLLKSIKESELTEIMNVSHDINKEIAEYSTGDWINCCNKECAELVSKLKVDERLECMGCNRTWLGCRYCDKSFYFRHNLLLHKISHLPTWACPHCDDRFWDHDKCKSHVKEIHGDSNFIPKMSRMRNNKKNA